jgi:diguanylate cyclase (GGDEF)-like protein
MFAKLLRSIREDKDLTDLTTLSREYNLKRIVYIAAFALIHQIINIFDTTRPLSGHVASLIAISALSSVYLLIILSRYKKLLAAKLDMPLSLSFWMLFLLCLSQYFVADMYRSGMPFNALLFCGLLVMVPIFSTRQSFYLFSLLVVQNLVLSIANNAPPSYFRLTWLLCVSAFVLSLLTQRQCVKMILSLLQENRLDPLTGIMNRRTGLGEMESLLDLCKRHGRPIAAFMIDIDFFKTYNDTLGHLQADNALRDIANAMSGAFERRTDIFCRYGGEEFLACCSIQKEEDAAHLADKLQAIVKNAGIHVPDKSLGEHLTVSIGYTVYLPAASKTGSGKNHFALINEADQALYMAKAAGRNRTERFIRRHSEQQVAVIENDGAPANRMVDGAARDKAAKR